MVPKVPHCLESIQVCEKHFDTRLGIIRGTQLKILVSIGEMREIFYIPTLLVAMDEFDREGLENYWKGRRDALSFYNTMYGRDTRNKELPHFPLSIK